MYELELWRCPACLFTVIMLCSDSTTVKSTSVIGFTAVLDRSEKDGGAFTPPIGNTLLNQM